MANPGKRVYFEAAKPGDSMLPILLLLVSNVFMTFAWYGHLNFNTAQLKIIQEVITLAVFAVLSVLYLKESLKWNHGAAALCRVGAVFFVFKR